MNRVLMIAFHFPPLAGSSGIQRTLRFVQHLPRFGWEPLVLTANSRAYERTSLDLNADIRAGTVVRRAFALDTARHLSVAGRYIGAMARPDRWMSWRFDAVRQGMKLIREFQPTAIWSTYPIATAHLIGAELCRRSGLPWIADFRDPMAQDGYPDDPLTWNQYRNIEEQAIVNAAASTFTTPSAAREYRQRYPSASTRVHVLENGYDDESFAAVESVCVGEAKIPLNPGAVTVLHSGIVYPQERDPTQLMAALRRLADAGAITPARLKVRFRAAVHDDLIRTLAAHHGVLEYVETLPPLSYRDALLEMLRADTLLVMQASNCNAQIPAKLYEYLRAGRPILCLTDPAGDTAGVLRAAGIDSITRLDDAEGIAATLRDLLESHTRSSSTVAPPDVVRAASRLGRTEQLSQLLDSVTARTLAR